MDKSNSPDKKRERSSSPFIFDLIHSMTRGEKKFFKQSGKTDEDAKNYIRLFEIFEEQKSFNDKAAYEAIRDKIEGENNYRTRKQYVITQILKWMRSYSGTETLVDREIKWKISDLKFLIEKGFYNEAEKNLQKVKQVAEAGESFIDLLEIIEIEYGLLTAIEDVEDLPARVDDLESLTNKCLTSLQNYFQHLHNFTSFQLHTRPVNKDKNEVTKGEEEKTRNTEKLDKPKMLRAMVFDKLKEYHEENRRYHGEGEDMDEGKHFTQTYYQQEQFFSEVSKQMAEGKIIPPDLYAQLLASLVIQARSALPFDPNPSKDALRILEGIEPQSHRIKLEKQYWTYWSLMSNATQRKNQEELVKLFDKNSDIEGFILRYKDNFRPDQQIRFLFVYAVFLAENDKYSECRDYLKTLIIDFGRKAPIRQDIVIVAHLLLLVCDYMLRDIIDLTSHIYLTESYFKKTKRFTNQKKLIFGFFKEISAQDGKVYQRTINFILESIKNWSTQDRYILKFYDFEKWFSSIKGDM
jgi:hypothetical protein